MNGTNRLLQPNDLLLFAHVVAWGSFSRAAEQLEIPKSSLSRRISQLEEQLGEKLLRRTTRKLALTEFGQELLEHANQIRDATEAANAFAQHCRIRPQGRLRVSMPSDFANVVLAELLSAFAALHPEVSLDIDLSPRAVDLIAERFDIALRIGSLPANISLNARRFGQFAVGLYAAPSYLAEYGMPSSPQNLNNHMGLSLPDKTSAGPQTWLLSHNGQQHAITPAARIVANSPELLLRLSRAGAGIAAAPEIYTPEFVAKRELVRILPQWTLPPVSGWALFPERRLMPAKTRAFLDMLIGCNLPGDASAAPRRR